jgi:hypothetical protein
MTSANIFQSTAAEITITKGNGRYNIAVDGTPAGWTHKNANGTWSVRINSTQGDRYENYAEVVAQEATRTDALKTFGRWIRSNPFFMHYIEEKIAADTAADAWLASL